MIRRILGCSFVASIVMLFAAFPLAAAETTPASNLDKVWAPLHRRAADRMRPTHIRKRRQTWATPVTLAMDTIVTVTQGTTVTTPVVVANKGTSSYYNGQYYIPENCSGMHCTFTSGSSDTWYSFPGYGSPVTRTLSITAPATILPTSYVAWIGVITEEEDGYGGYVDTFDSLRIHINVVASNPTAPLPPQFMWVNDSVLYFAPTVANDSARVRIKNNNTVASYRTVQYTYNCGSSLCASYPSPTYLSPGELAWLRFDVYAGSRTNHFARMIASIGYGSSYGFVTEAMDTVTFEVRYGLTQAPRVIPLSTARQLLPFQPATDSFYVKNKGNDTTVYSTTYDLTPTCGRFTGVCALSATSVTQFRGDSTLVTLTYVADSTVSSTNDVRVRAVRHDSTAERDSATIRLSIVDNTAPTITIAGLTDTLRTPAALVTITTCDADGTVRTTSATFNAAALNPALIPTTVSGCHSAKTMGYAITMRPGRDTVSVSASDGVHTTTASRIVTYDPTDEHKPVVTPLAATRTVLISAAGVDTFVVKNPGSASATYSLAASCTVFATGCTASTSSVTIGAGQSQKVTINYSYSGSIATGAVLSLTATYTGYFGRVVSTTGSSTLNAMSGTAPSISLLPATGTVTVSATDISVTWCSTSALTTHDVYMDSVKINDTFQATTGSCAVNGTSTWTNMHLHPWAQTISAVAVDAQGRRYSIGNTITYNTPLSAVTPQVTPKNTAATYPRSMANTLLFTVKNPTDIDQTYALATNCGGYSDCAIYRSSMRLAPFKDDTVRVYFTTSSTPETAATIKLIATYTTPASTAVADTGAVAASTPTYAALYQAQVSPTTASEFVPAGVYVGGYGNFSIKNIGTDTATYTLSNTLLGSGFTLLYPLDTYPLVVAPGQTKPIYPSFLTGSAGATATDSLRAGLVVSGLWKASSKGTYTLRTQNVTYGLAVTPTMGNVMQIAPNQSGAYGFNVTNSGTTTEHPTYSCKKGGYVVNCSIEGAPSAILAGQTVSFAVLFTTSAQTSQSEYSLGLKVVGNVTDSAMVTIQPPSSVPFRSVAVSPSATSTQEVLTSATNNFTFTIRNQGNVPTSYIYVVGCTGAAATSCRLTNPTWYSPGLYIPVLNLWIPSVSDLIGWTAPLNPGDAATVSVTYATSATLADQGKVTLTASDTTTTATVQAQGTLNIRTAVLDSVSVVARTINPGTSINRASCLTIAVSEAAAYECGELRVMHALPTVTTMGKARTPTLIYNSRSSAPSAVLAANVTMNVMQATSVVPKLTLSSPSITTKVVTYGSVGWNQTWPLGTVGRISVPINADSLNLPTGAYHYVLEIGAINGATTLTGHDSGTVVIVNRSNSPFGSGWWLDGLEQLVAVDSLHKLWIGGDGSSRMYRRADTLATTYLATPMVDRPDTLTRLSGTSGFRRRLRNGAYVGFDVSGNHVETINALGESTLFRRTGTRLDTIVVPVPSGGPRRAYSFEYLTDTNGVTRISTIHAPDASVDRVTTFSTYSSGAITKILHLLSPDSLRDSVLFTYSLSPTGSPASPVGRLVTRTNRAGYVATFDYDAGGLSQAQLNMGTTGAHIVHKFCPAETIGLTQCSGAPELASNASTLWNGPRTDIADTSRFFLNQYGAPSVLRNALGYVTSIEYDTLFSLLPTRVTKANGFVTEASYNTRGLLEKNTARNPFETGDATTTYHYHTKWDLADSVASPIPGEFVLRQFHSTWPVDTAQSDARGDSSKSAVYLTSAGRVHLLRAPGQAADTGTHIGYDALGNLYQSKTLLGATETHYRDVNGLDSVITSKLDASGAVLSTLIYRDALGRDTLTITRGPHAALNISSRQEFSTTAFEEISVRKWFNKNDALDSLTRRISPNPNNIKPLTTRWTYDHAGRKLSEKAPDGATEYYAFGDGVNMTVLTNRKGETVTMSYDEGNQLRSKTYSTAGSSSRPTGTLTVPSQVDSFYYDAVGNMTHANNPFAQITRTYTPAGALKTEIQSLASASKAFGSSAHNYQLKYEYDPAGRRLRTTYPTALSLDGGGADYGYDIAGQLHSITTGSQHYVFDLDKRGRTFRLTLPNGIVERKSFDDDDRMTALSQTAPSYNLGWNGDTSNVIRADSILRDLQGRAINVLSAKSGNVDMAYNAVGPLQAYRRGATSSSTAIDELYSVDPMGLVTCSYGTGTCAGDVHTYDTLTARLTKLSNESAFNPQVTPYYDAAGNQEYVTSGHLAAALDAWSGEYVISRTKTLNGYDAAGRLRLVRVRGDTGTDVLASVENTYADEETRYDALGRRVWVSSAHTSTPEACSIYCSVTRFVHDGEQVIGEFRMPWEHRENDLSAIFDWVYVADTTGSMGIPIMYPPIIGADSVQRYSWRWGRVVYTHGPGIDAPLGIMRGEGGFGSELVDAFTMYPLQDWRGNMAKMSFGNAAPIKSYVANASPPIQDDQEQLPAYRARVQTTWAVNSWIGSLANGQRGETGLEYRRNRYYDPQQGQFTQEDPIGLAGGMNLYGFGGGDPVNRSDPFGLCPDENDPKCSLAQAVIDGAKAQARQMLDAVGGFGNQLASALSSGAGRVSVYAKAAMGTMSGQVDADMSGRAGARFQMDANTEILGIAGGISVDLMEAPLGSHPIGGNIPFGIGSATIGISVGSNGIAITSAGVEIGKGINRGGQPSGKGVSAQVPGSPAGCIGTRNCP